MTASDITAMTAMPMALFTDGVIVFLLIITLLEIHYFLPFYWDFGTLFILSQL